MKVLILTCYYPPEHAASIYLLSNLAEDLARHGCEVEVIAPVPCRGLDEHTRRKYRSLRREEKYDGRLVVRRILIPFAESHRTLARAVRYIIISLVLLVAGLFSKADVVKVYSTPPTMGIVGALLRILRRIPVVYEVQDIFPDSLVNSGVSSSSAIIALGRLMERLSYRHASRIIVISRDFRDNLVAKGVASDKIDVVYNWVDERAVSPVQRDQNVLVGRYALDASAFYVSYCGNIGHTQNLEMLVDVAAELMHLGDLKFIIIGDGAHAQALKRYAADREARNVVFLPFQPYEDISHVFSLGDVGLVISKKNIGMNSFPSKTWSIMSAARPVLASFDRDSELREIIENADCGRYVAAEDKVGLQDAVLWMYQSRDCLERYGKNGREFVLRNLTRWVGATRNYEALCKAMRH